MPLDLEARKAYDDARVLVRRKAKWAAETAVDFEYRPLDPELIIEDIESFIVPHGRGAGEPFKLAPFQVQYVRDAFGDGVTEAWLTCSRKNGKTAFLSAVCLALMVRPPKPNYQILVAAASGELTLLFARLLRQIAVMSGVVGPDNLIPERDMRNPGKAPVRFIGRGRSELLCQTTSDRTGHGHGADLAILDESGLFERRFAHVVTSLVASTVTRGGRLLSISIRGKSGIVEEAEARADGKRVIFHDYSAPPDCMLDDLCALRASNPGIGLIMPEERLIGLSATAAKAPPERQAHFRSQHLNAGGDPEAVRLVELATWEDALVSRDEELPSRSGPVTIGLDVGGARALTSFAMYWYETGRLEVISCCGSNPSLKRREQFSSVGNVLTTALDLGSLVVMGNRQSDLAEFFRHVADLMDGEDMVALMFDRYRKREAEDLLDQHGPWTDERIERVGGWRDASEDIRAAERELLSGRVKVHRCPLLTTAYLEARVMDDGRGNVRLGKRDVNRSLSDPFSATVLALGEGHRRHEGAGDEAIDNLLALYSDLEAA